MLILKAKNADSLHQLQSYSSSLNGGRVKSKSIYNKVAKLYNVLCYTKEDARYIELKEDEVNTIFKEYLKYLCSRYCIVATVYYGHLVSAYAKEQIDNELLKNVHSVFSFPTSYTNNTIIIYLNIMNYNYDIDLAINMLKYHDQ